MYQAPLLNSYNYYTLNGFIGLALAVLGLNTVMQVVKLLDIPPHLRETIVDLYGVITCSGQASRVPIPDASPYLPLVILNSNLA
jgi:hypothetical protein